MATGVRTAEVDYPCSDGKPMAESDLHRRVMVDVIEALRGRFATDPTVYVSGNLLVYYQEGDPLKHLAPDCFVVRGIPGHDRETYKVWEEGRYPDFVLEITSRTTKGDDLGRKLEAYRDLWKVREYFLFDPREEYLTPSFRGFRLVEGAYQPLQPTRGQFVSEVLGLKLEREGTRLVFRDPETGHPVLRPDLERVRVAELERELAEAKADAATAELEEAIERGKAAEADAARLKAELDALRNPPPTA